MSSDETDVALLLEETRQPDTTVGDEEESQTVEHGDLEKTFTPLFEQATQEDPADDTGSQPRTLADRLRTRGSMDRITLRLPTRMVTEVDQAVDDGHYPDRSKAIRDAIREKFIEHPRPERSRGGRR